MTFLYMTIYGLYAVMNEPLPFPLLKYYKIETLSPEYTIINKSLITILSCTTRVIFEPGCQKPKKRLCRNAIV